MPKIPPRHYFYFVFSFIFLWIYAWPVCPLNWHIYIKPFLILLGVLLVIELLILYRTSYVIIGHLKKGDIQQFLKDTDTEIKYAPGRVWKNYYTINKTAGLYYLGQFEEALTLLDTIQFNKLPKAHKILYINNRLANLLGRKRIEDAEKLLNEHPEYSLNSIPNKQFYSSIAANLGVVHYYKGKKEVARFLMEESMKNNSFCLSQAIIHYFLALMDQEEGRSESAKEHFKKVKDLGKDTYIAQRVAQT